LLDGATVVRGDGVDDGLTVNTVLGNLISSAAYTVLMVGVVRTPPDSPPYTPDTRYGYLAVDQDSFFIIDYDKQEENLQVFHYDGAGPRSGYHWLEMPLAANEPFSLVVTWNAGTLTMRLNGDVEQSVQSTGGSWSGIHDVRFLAYNPTPAPLSNAVHADLAELITVRQVIGASDLVRYDAYTLRTYGL
jgi:hypothetical protein